MRGYSESKTSIGACGRVRIVFITETFHKQMGYLENCLPPHLAMQGHEVHILTSSLPPYYRMGKSESVLGNFANCGQLKSGQIEDYDGCTLHVLPHGTLTGRVYFKQLRATLRALKPDVVQITTPIGPLALDVARIRQVERFALFTGNHQGFSTFPVAQRNLAWFHPDRLKVWLTRFVHGRLIGMLTELCYAVTSDCGEVAWRYFGVPRQKVKVVHLGSDTRYFHPVRNADQQKLRTSLREQLGSDETRIVCIFTGKMDDFRNPLLLAQAVRELQSKGKPFEALFIGAGKQRTTIEAMGFPVLDFMPFRQLGDYYRAADIGVWPGPESISQLDAAACGLPLIVGDVGHYRDHVNGNGIVYKTGDIVDLTNALLELEKSHTRARLGGFGAQKIAEEFSWTSIASRRLQDYQAALASRSRRTG